MSQLYCMIKKSYYSGVRITTGAAEPKTARERGPCLTTRARQDHEQNETPARDNAAATGTANLRLTVRNGSVRSISDSPV